MIVGVLLAAGGARRFGSQKLVAQVAGVPIVRRAAEALAAGTDALVAVTGNESAAVGVALAGMAITLVHNPDWSLGLAGSLRQGIAALDETCEAAIVAVGDQPHLDPEMVARVAACWRTMRRPIVSARYLGTGGHPVLFAREVFAELVQLEGDAGARLLIERNPERVAYVDTDAPMPADVDTAADLRRLDG